MEYSIDGIPLLNEYQTPLDDILRSKIHAEVYQDIIECIDSIPFIESLITQDMPNISDMPKDTEGKVIVNLIKPHRLVNLEYFREAAIHFDKHGTYTFFTKNPHPKSKYNLFWKEEKRKCLEGVVRPDGEWIPGVLYFYWNYCRIQLTKNKNKSKRADRIEGFAKPWLGDYLFFHYLEKARNEGKHGGVIKQRGVGFSFKGAVFGPYYGLFFKKQKSFYTAFEKEYLTNDGVLNKVWDYIDFLAKHTEFPRTRITDSFPGMKLKFGYKDPANNNAQKGTLGEVIGISAKDNPGKIRGKRGFIFFEEFGKFPKVSDTWNVCRDSVEDGGVAFSQMICGGTGGEVGSNFAGAEDMIYHPDVYNIYGIPNVFDKNSSGEKVIFHWGSYLNRNLCYDENGMPDVIKALSEVLTEFHNIKKSSTDGKALTQRKAEKAITIQDAIMRVEGTLFPVVDLKDYLDTIKAKGTAFYDMNYVGDLLLSENNTVKYKTSNKYPLRKYKIPKGDDRVGAVELYQMPQKDKSGVIKDRYIFGADPISDDAGASLGSIFGFDTWTQTIVCEYTGRPKFADEFYEVCRRMVMFYSGVLLYENNLKGLFTYFKQKNSIHLLSGVPQILLDKQMMKQAGQGNKAFGVHASKDINNYARGRIRDWLLREAHYTYQEFEGEKQTTQYLNMHTIKSTALLDELIAWNPDGNFDRVSGLGMVMLLNEERKQYMGDTYKEKVALNDTFINDKYFTDNFDNRFSYSFNNKEDDIF